LRQTLFSVNFRGNEMPLRPILGAKLTTFYVFYATELKKSVFFTKDLRKKQFLMQPGGLIPLQHKRL